MFTTLGITCSIAATVVSRRMSTSDVSASARNTPKDNKNTLHRSTPVFLKADWGNLILILTRQSTF
jgi:hypothetical protein